MAYFPYQKSASSVENLGGFGVKFSDFDQNRHFWKFPEPRQIYQKSDFRQKIYVKSRKTTNTFQKMALFLTLPPYAAHISGKIGGKNAKNRRYVGRVGRTRSDFKTRPKIGEVRSREAQNSLFFTKNLLFCNICYFWKK